MRGNACKLKCEWCQTDACVQGGDQIHDKNMRHVPFFVVGMPLMHFKVADTEHRGQHKV